MEQKRERRIRDRLRMKAKARRIGSIKRLYISDTVERSTSYDLLYDHLCVCSGPCCGNPRRWYGEPTMQERRFLAG